MIFSSRRSSFITLTSLLILAILITTQHDPNQLASTTSSSSPSLSFTPTFLRVDGAMKKLTEKELGEIEDQWMEDEVEDEDDTPFKYTRTADGGRMPPSPAGPKTEMGFVTLKPGGSKRKTDELAGRWSDQMLSGGIDTRGYTIEDNRILFVCDQRGFKDMNRVREFVLRQPETMEFEWNNKKSVPGDIPKDDDGPAGAADPLAKFQEMQDEMARKQKREAKAKKKEAEAKKRKAEKAKREKEAKKKKLEAEKKKKAEEAKKKAEAEAKQAAEPSLKTEL